MQQESEQTPPSGGTAIDVRIGRSRWRVPAAIVLGVVTAVGSAFAGARIGNPPAPERPLSPAEDAQEIRALRRDVHDLRDEMRAGFRGTRADVGELRSEVRELRETKADKPRR